MALEITWKVHYSEYEKPLTRAELRRTITPTMRRKVLKAYNATCVRCGSESNLHIDHIIPFSHGGTTTFDNLQVLCAPCNLRKNNYDPHEDPYLLSKDMEF